MGALLYEKIKEAGQSVFPIVLTMMLLHFTIAPMPLSTIILFLSGAVLLILGVGMFTLGADMAMMPIGSHIGANLMASRKLWFLLVGGLILGFFITIAEPDLQILSMKVPSIPSLVLIWTVAIGVGGFLSLALYRILKQIKLSTLFIATYIMVFIAAILTAPEYLPVAFDSGGVTTGPITVPFILAFGAGIAAVRSGRSAEEDSFGLCGICSVGPILAVAILGMLYKPSGAGYAYESPSVVHSGMEMLALYANGLWTFFKEVILALAPIAIIFAFFQVFRLKLPKSQVIKIVVGLLYTLLGLLIFLTGANIGFMPAGTFMGGAIASLSYRWILLPLGMLLGAFIVAVEPAVHVLTKQVEEITVGTISPHMLMIGLAIGVGFGVSLALLRVLTGMSIWYALIPGYAIALILTRIVPPIFTAIAFDSGGVASGVMATTFLLPFALGATEAIGGNPMTDAFGIVAMVAMMPLVTVQVIGLIYMIKSRRIEKLEALGALQRATADDTDIVDL
jgi:hypothetical protein